MSSESVYIELYITREKIDSGYILKCDTDVIAVNGNGQHRDYDEYISEDFVKELWDKYHIEID